MPIEQESHHYNCDTCKDKGFIFGEVNGYEVASKCKCKVKEEIANKANRSGLADLFKTKTKQYVHLYYNGIQAEYDKLTIHDRWKKMDKALDEKVEKKLKRKEDIKQYEKYYKLKFDDHGYFQNFRRKDNALKKLMSQVGYFAIITSEKMSASEALNAYRNRDAIEKIFRMEKSYLGNDVFRVHSNVRLESKMFISLLPLSSVMRSIKK